MNQRSKRSSQRKADMTISTGSFIARHEASGAEAEVRIPQKATGDVPASNMGSFAKASPLFKELEVIIPKDEKKAIADNMTKVVGSGVMPSGNANKI